MPVDPDRIRPRQRMPVRLVRHGRPDARALQRLDLHSQFRNDEIARAAGEDVQLEKRTIATRVILRRTFRLPPAGRALDGGHHAG